MLYVPVSYVTHNLEGNPETPLLNESLLVCFQTTIYVKLEALFSDEQNSS